MNRPEQSKPVTADEYTHYLLGGTTQRLSCAVEDAGALRHWQQALRSDLVERTGIARIAMRCSGPPVPFKRGEQRLDDHVREEWELETEPGFRVPFFLLRPLKADGPRPLVLTPHGHGRRSRYTYCGIAEDDRAEASIREGERDIALQAVREGYVAIAPEARAFDESRTTKDVEKEAGNSCYDRQMRALMFGRTLIGERVWDIMRLIDYAGTREDIDTSRIAISGNSGGGTAALFAAAIDVRIGVAVPGSYFCTFADSIGAMHHCACNYIPGILEVAEMPDVAGLIAPRPLLIVHGREDPIFPIEATRRAFASVQRIYKVAGVADRCELFVGDGGHRFYKEPVWPFVTKWYNASETESDLSRAAAPTGAEAQEEGHSSTVSGSVHSSTGGSRP